MKSQKKLIQLGRSTSDFKYRVDGCLTTNKDVPKSAIVYNEEFIKLLFNMYGFKIVQPISYGSWCKRDSFLSYQDMIIASKGNTN